MYNCNNMFLGDVFLSNIHDSWLDKKTHGVFLSLSNYILYRETWIFYFYRNQQDSEKGLQSKRITWLTVNLGPSDVLSVQ